MNATLKFSRLLVIVMVAALVVVGMAFLLINGMDHWGHTLLSQGPQIMFGG